ncbi:universal stress protein [Larsenimonas rhizosphaerae]|uniref:Universal stress protein n=1 Tax=Larsenimonas rhizosphaerae TaxID=2944682 RepID=A0AA41ZNG5_9GAMM|nr:universal stress protein [Larsenimonas rhizosphaerae]MCM2131540.1 universal stress protein [Larsenimonas rhizosphaerae]MCX2525133.1 universal stress protein [Larsenimonas rhizosphaerae]
MTQTLLLATDLSNECRAAFSRAVLLANEHHARLNILHVLDPFLPRAALRELEKAVSREIEQLLIDTCESLGSPRPNTMIQVVTGTPYAEIIREVYEQKADLAILGSHRKHHQQDLVTGTTVSRVMRRAPCPVLSISHSTKRNWQDVLVPIDFSLASRHTLKEVLLRFPDIRLTLLHVWDMPASRELASDPGYARWRNEERTKLRQQLEFETERFMADIDDVPDLELVLEQGDPTEVLIQRVRDQPPDLLALGSHGRIGIGRRTAGSLLERLLSETRCDIMLCRTW